MVGLDDQNSFPAYVSMIIEASRCREADFWHPSTLSSASLSRWEGALLSLSIWKTTL